MARNTRIFSDIDFSFIPSPLSTEKMTAAGTITTSTSSTSVTGQSTFFDNTYVYCNLYVGSTFIGKVKSVQSATALTLYTNAKSSVTTQGFSVSTPGDITKKYDETAIKAAVKHLVLTSNYERPFHSEIGSQLKNLLFEPADPYTHLRIEQTITQTILNFEPRVNLISVKAKSSPDNNSVYVTVEFTIVNTQTPLTVTLLLERTR